MPLISKGIVQGVVEAVNKGYATFDEHDLRVMEALTSSASIAIENARLFSMLNQETRRLEFLHHLSQQLAASLDMREVAQRALDGLRAVAGLLRGLVAIRERDALRLLAVSGYDAESVEALNQRLPLRVGYGLIGWVAAHRQPAIVDDVMQDPRWVVVSGVDEWVRSALSVPLVSGDELVGVLSIYSDRVAYFTEDIRRLVESTAATVAVAITNAHLYSTERQRATELARALEQQREMDRLQREFIQNVSHELRTPLALIRGHAEVLENGWLGELQPEQKESIGVITRRAQMLGKLVDDIMGILEVERQELKREPVDLTSLVRTSLADFQPAADKAGLTLSAVIVPDLPLVLGDSLALRRVLDNLVSNAIKFTPADGRVTVRLFRSEQVVRLEVADTGIGIPSEHLGRIFDRFYQVDGSTTRKYGGVGLGLALVKAIVEAHGGQITVASEGGVGTTFTFTLPIAAQDDTVTQ
jgi:signal transduction histidine kinase